jgi:hypothetical protein
MNIGYNKLVLEQQEEKLILNIRTEIKRERDERMKVKENLKIESIVIGNQ